VAVLVAGAPALAIVPMFGEDPDEQALEAARTTPASAAAPIIALALTSHAPVIRPRVTGLQ
jgi:hypothetical protein